MLEAIKERKINEIPNEMNKKQEEIEQPKSFGNILQEELQKKGLKICDISK